MNPNRVSRITFSSETIDCIVFWTKDPAPLMPHLETIRNMGYEFYFQYTLAPYDQRMEKNLRDKEDRTEAFIELSKRVGKERVVWRYDPIILNSFLTLDYHRQAFIRLCEKLSPYTECVTISFVDLYPKLKTDLLRPITPEEMAVLSEYIGRTAREYGLVPKACCEAMDFSSCGIGSAGCIDRSRIEKLIGCPLAIGPDKNQRAGCGCVESVDIGAYDTCLNGCVYCYANRGPDTARRRFERHDPLGEMLIGGLQEGDKVTEKPAVSAKQTQLSLY